MTSKGKNSQYETSREIAELKRGMTELGIVFSEDMIRKFKVYLNFLHAYHGKIHLLSHRDYGRISRRHFLPSLVAIQYVKKHKHVCDVGSGAGFPSIPLKIVLTELELVVFESQRKKAYFLEQLIDVLGLEGIKVMQMRAESYSGGSFDLALLKAVGTIKYLAKVLDRLLESGGKAIFYKTSRVEQELKIASKLLDKLHFSAEVKKIQTPVERIPLALVILHKK